MDTKFKYTWKKKAKDEIGDYFACTKNGFIKFVFSSFPFLICIGEYKWKRDAISDLVAGITVGIMSIPQGMSYAGVAGVPGIYGLYSNFIPTITYFFFGTSKVAAIGTDAALSIMMGNVRHKSIPDSRVDISPGCIFNDTDTDLDLDFQNPACFTSWELLASTTFLIGIFLIIMGFLHLGFLSNYLSDHLIGGMTCGITIHVMLSQMDYIFGTHLPWHSGPGKIIFTVIDFCEHIQDVVPATIIISIICIGSLLVIKFYLSKKFQKFFGVPFPGELMMVIIGIIASYFGHLEDRFHVDTVHKVSPGFPQAVVPRFELMRLVALDAFYTSVVLYCQAISLAKLYAKRNDYKIDANQEFFAFGITNLMGSFFQCFASGYCVARSIVFESAGGKTQFTAIYGSILVIITALWVAPVLAPLPKAILGSIIWAACIQMLTQLKQLRKLYTNSKIDFLIYIFAFVSVIILDIKEGLITSIAFAILVGLIRMIWAKIRKNQLKDSNSPYRELANEKPRPKDKIFRFKDPLYFANADRFQREIFEFCGLSTDDLRQDASDMELGLIHIHERISTISTSTENLDITNDYVIIDCSAFDYIDSMGVRALRQIDIYLLRRAIIPYYVKCTGDNLEKLETAQFLDDTRRIRLFPTAEIAISAAGSRNRSNGYGSNDDSPNDHVASDSI